LAYLERFAKEFFGAKATASTVVRRALLALEITDENLRSNCDKDPESSYRYRSIESRALNSCNNPRRIYGITTEQVRESLELKSPAALARERALSSYVSIPDQLKADLKRWNAGNE
jgi:hypothetical protein